MTKIYGYCRISSDKQNIDRQERNILKEYPDALIVKEIFSGAKFQGRKELQKIVDNVKSGDTIVFDSVSRMSRNAEEGFSLYEELYNRGVELVFLKEPLINTQTYRKTLQDKMITLPDAGDEDTNRLMNGILSSLNEYILALARRQIRLAFEQSQKEVDDLRQRTKEGIETARRNGKQIGQQRGRKLKVKKEKPIKELILKYSRRFKGVLKDKEVMSIINGMDSLHVSHNTYQKYKNELKVEETEG